MKIVGFKYRGDNKPKSWDLAPKKRHQMLVDRDLGEVIKGVSKALGYRSASGLMNDALVYFIEHEYPDIKLDFEEEASEA